MLNLGNTSLFVGVFSGARLVVQFRVPIGAVLAPGGFSKHVVPRVRGKIGRVALCSVVPTATKKITASVRREWNLTPSLLTADSVHGLTIGYRKPRQLGTDRVAAALGAQKLFPRKNVLVVDCGTATTVTALRRDGVLLGGAIFPGMALWSDMLAARTAQLPRVKLRQPRTALGNSTQAALESGIFHGQAGAIREVVRRIRDEAFGRAAVVVVGTGGNAAQFSKEAIFDEIVPALVLVGLDRFSKQTVAQGL